MSQVAANDALKDINEAFNYLRPLVVAEEKITPSNYRSATSEAEKSESSDEYAYGYTEEELREYAYRYAISDMNEAETAEDYEIAAATFEYCGDYRDAKHYKAKCLREAREIRREEFEKRSSTSSGSNQAKARERKDVDGYESTQRILRLMLWGSIIGLIVILAVTRSGILSSLQNGKAQNTGSGTESSSITQTDERAYNNIPDGIEESKAYLYEEVPEVLFEEESKEIVRQGRVDESVWSNAPSALQRITFGRVSSVGIPAESFIAFWSASDDSIESFYATDEVASLAVSQMIGDLDLARNICSNVEMWSWIEPDTGEQRIERHESFEVDGKTWHLRIAANFEEITSGARGQVWISETPFDPPSSEGKERCEHTQS